MTQISVLHLNLLIFVGKFLQNLVTLILRPPSIELNKIVSVGWIWKVMTCIFFLIYICGSNIVIKLIINCKIEALSKIFHLDILKLLFKRKTIVNVCKIGHHLCSITPWITLHAALVYFFLRFQIRVRRSIILKSFWNHKRVIQKLIFY